MYYRDGEYGAGSRSCKYIGTGAYGASCQRTFPYLPQIRCAGAIFVGAYSPEPLGDYFAGPNHVLPTGGTARFYSVLNVETFMKRTSIISYTQKALDEVSDDIVRLAETEGLNAHARAIQIRRGERAELS